MATRRTKASQNYPQEAAEGAAEEAAGVITIKKYANRRLYNTATSSYVTLEYLCQMVKDGQDFVVYDAKSGDDITRPVLTQIIVEEESKGQNMLPISFLRQLIGFYGDNLQMVLPRYLEFAMATFVKDQDRSRDYMQQALGTMFPFSNFEEMGKQNMAMLEKPWAFSTPIERKTVRPVKSARYRQAMRYMRLNQPTRLRLRLMHYTHYSNRLCSCSSNWLPERGKYGRSGNRQK